MNRYFNKNKYLTLVPTNESKEIIKKYEELWSKIRDLIRSITKKSDHYDQKYMKIKFDSDNDLPLIKMIEIHNVTIVVRDIFYENNKYCPHFFLDECLYQLQIIKMLHYDSIDISEGNDVNKTSESKECDICHY